MIGLLASTLSHIPPAQATSGHLLIRLITEGGQTKEDEPFALTTESDLTDWSEYAIHSGDNINETIHAQLQLPQGCNLEHIVAYGDDGEASFAITFLLFRSYIGNENPVQIASWSSINNTDYWASEDIDITINNNFYSYWVTAFIQGNKDLTV